MDKVFIETLEKAINIVKNDSKVDIASINLRPYYDKSGCRQVMCKMSVKGTICINSEQR